MKIEIWSDYVCPFCYIGERKLEKALEKTGMLENVELIFKSFELDPNAKKSYSDNINQLIAKKYNMSIERAEEANANIISVAKEVGLDFNFENLKPTNSFDAHRLSHYAREKGRLKECTEAVMKSYFTDSLNISDTDVLASLAVGVGLNKEEVERILKSSEYTTEVRNDEAEAASLGVSGVPYFRFDGKKAVSGAQPVDAFVAIIEELK